MTNIPLRLRLALLFGSVGCAIGSLAALLFDSGLVILALGIILGALGGFITGFAVGGLTRTGQALPRAELISSGAEAAIIVLGWILVAAGLVALALTGGSIPLLLSTLFFFAGSLFFTYRRLRK